MDILKGINTIKSTADLIKNVVNQYIVRPTGSGVNGFVFDVTDEEQMFLDSEITDHYVEDNFAIQDHIAQRPERFVLRGFVAELSDIFPATFLGVLQGVQSLSSIGGFLPTFASQATQAYGKVADVVSRAGNVLNQAQNIYDMFLSKNTSATKQQSALNYFKSLWLSRTLCTIDTPFGILEDMAIESVRATQHNDTRFVSDFSVTFKRIRITSTSSFGPVLESAFNKLSIGRVNDMLKGIQNNGSTAGVTKDPLTGQDIAVAGNLQGSFNIWQNNQLNM